MQTKTFDMDSFRRRMEGHLGGPGGEAALFWDALSCADKAHSGQYRMSGEPYISHPCLVARILVEELYVRDSETLAAALLHDTVEDVPEISCEDLGARFGKNIEAIVKGCTKISHFVGNRRTFYNLVHRKIFSGSASHIAVILVKLADRLHNLRTMDSLPKSKRQKIAGETLDVYAPMAMVLGLFALKRELYDLALTYKFPKQSKNIKAIISRHGTNEKALAIRRSLQEEMERAWITSEISIRPRRLSAYYNSVNKVLTREIENPVQIIIVVDDIQSCYRALGVLNQNFPPTPRSIRDFISNPKPTGYQSLHAKANINGSNYLFKIRTREMLQSAQAGVISKWLSHGKAPTDFEKEIREMFDIMGGDNGISCREMIAASGKKEIYTFTPRGYRICLPRDSIVLDFAFKVHTEIGHRCDYAIVSGKKVRSDYMLRDGDRVKIILSDAPIYFEPAIQKLCQSPRARAEVSRMFRLRLETFEKNVGRSLIMQELKRNGVPVEVMEKEEMTYILEYFGYENPEDLFLHVGDGRLGLRELVYEIKNGLYSGASALHPPTGALNRIELTSLDPICIKFSRCCNPVPTEKGLFGVPTERSLSVHKGKCKEFRSLKFQREDVVELRWQLKKTVVRQPQTILFLDVSKSRLMMTIGAGPDEMRITEITSLYKSLAGMPDWEVKFRVENLRVLKNVLAFFEKTGLTYEFVLDM
ncbi:MAG: HD domain-containing protein [Thermodesulfobacteriota bacterium]|nr:HD domain-containing protein [Thermodesulfobacteriota bacterium]